jgi:hypothetical protein
MLCGMPFIIMGSLPHWLHTMDMMEAVGIYEYGISAREILYTHRSG